MEHGTCPHFVSTEDKLPSIMCSATGKSLVGEDVRPDWCPEKKYTDENCNALPGTLTTTLIELIGFDGEVYDKKVTVFKHKSPISS
jgi:hypothetical protein